MKKYNSMQFQKLTLLSVLMLFLITSCKKEVVKKDPAKFSVEEKTITVNWTGYKTTDKTAVKSEFKEIKIQNVKMDSTAVGALNGAHFDIPVSSLFSNDAIRDDKLKNLFFAAMDATLSLTGTLNLKNDGTGNIDLTMNGVQKQIPITHITSGQLVELEGMMVLDDWNAQGALAALAEACFDLHKGADGVSKTWNEVMVSAAVYLKKE